MRPAAILQAVIVLRIELQRRGVVGDGLLPGLPIHVDVGAPPMRIGVFRIEPDRLGIARDPAREVALLVVAEAAVRRGDALDRLRLAAALDDRRAAGDLAIRIRILLAIGPRLGIGLVRHARRRRGGGFAAGAVAPGCAGALNGLAAWPPPGRSAAEA